MNSTSKLTARMSTVLIVLLTLSVVATFVPKEAVAAPTGQTTATTLSTMTSDYTATDQTAATLPTIASDDLATDQTAPADSVRRRGRWRCLRIPSISTAMVCAFFTGWRIGRIWSNIPWVEARMRGRLNRCWPRCSNWDFIRATFGI